ncbi:ATP-binding protein [Rubrivirga sp. IMCC43871]|uniref:sensor histidine kinase n=1 Tax=Rubrivirga sp. IMCC43871 TaxID=3391575 RepID=UPI00398FA8C2
MDGLTDVVPCGVALVREDGRIVDANQAFATALGLEPAALHGTPFHTVLSPQDRLYYETHLAPLLRLRGRLREVHLTLRGPDGIDVPVLVNAVHRDGPRGPVTVLAAMPIDQRSQFEDELLEARRAAETASESRARLLAMLSHDIRSPLSAITFAADLMRQGAHGPVAGDQADELDRIAEAGRYVLRLVTDVLEFSRLENGRIDVRPSSVDVGAEARAALALVESQAEAAGVAVSAEGPDGVRAWADRDRLRQILVNLLGNAVKFAGAGQAATVQWASDRNGVRVWVSDTGPGVAADRLDAVFVPFFQGDSRAEGAGLGLAICRELALAMGGTLTVESVVGEGATFAVALPAEAGTET